MRIQRRCSRGLWLATCLVLLAGTALAQEPVQVVQPVAQTAESLALTFPEGKTISVKLRGNDRLPKANGEAKVERKKGATEIEVELDEMKPATSFGGDYNTYVLWSVSPQGGASNLGEFVLSGNRSKLNVSTRLQNFGLFVTAEPHFLVKSPSRFVVMEMVRANTLGVPFETAKILYRGNEGTYRADRESLANVPEAKSEIRSDVAQARTAIRLAAAARADELASKEFAQAQLVLQQTEEAARGGVKNERVRQLAKQTVQRAYEAQLLSEQRAIERALEAERKAKAEEQVRLERERQQAELAQAEEARRRAQAEAAQARAQAEEERARREAEEARRQEQEARQKAEAARRQEEEARRKEEEARLAAERAEQEKQALRAQLLNQFNRILPTRDTPRGLLVTMADVLFDFGKYNLRPEAREALAKLTGIVLAHPGLELDVEGHTDSVGTEEFNQRLSERRAGAVRDYLVQQGLNADLLRARGFGETMPVVSNDTAAGRQQNRRVEIIVSGEVIGTKIGATPH